MRAFVIAMRSEADAVRSALPPDARVWVSGVGKVNAAAAAQAAIDAGATEIWNCGLAGGLDPEMCVGDVYEVDRAVEYDFDLAKLNGTRIGVHDERTTPYFDCVTSGIFPARTLATGDRFNDSAADFATLAELGASLRDMEGAAIAHVCERAGVPCRAFKCVSDVRGLGEMTAQYLENRVLSLRRLGEAVRRLFASVGP